MYSVYDVYDQDLNEGFVGMGPIMGSVLAHTALVLALVYLLGAGGRPGGSAKIEIEFIGSASAALAPTQPSYPPIPPIPQLKPVSSRSKEGKTEITKKASAKVSPPVQRKASVAPRGKAKMAPGLAAAPVLEHQDRLMTDDFAALEEDSSAEDALFEEQLEAARSLVATSISAFRDNSRLEDLLGQAEDEARQAAREAAELEERYKVQAQRQEARAQALTTRQAWSGVGSGEGNLVGDGVGSGSASQGSGDQNLSLNQALQRARSIEQLKQMPGNPRPQYSEDERYYGMEGGATILGYVTRSGELTQIRMVQSTGHISLDQKTLKAVSQWKFYPGQEGWVKIPFIWKLQGDPAGLGGRLRTQSGQN